MDSRKALLTGATGFVGFHVAHSLLDNGWSVHVILRAGSDVSRLAGIFDRITIHNHDGSMDGMMTILRESSPDVVFHLASLFLAQHNSEDVEPLIQSNLLFGAQLIEAMVSRGVFRLVNTGTSWQHYENRDYSPVNLYSATKQAFEDILQYYVETTSLSVISLMLFDTYGPNDPRPKLFTLLRRVAQEQQPLAMSPGEQLIDLVYIDDVTEAFMVAAKRLLQGSVQQHERYAVSSGKPIKLQELVKVYGQFIGKELLIIWGGRPYRTREVMVPWNTGDGIPGWAPNVELEEGIRRMEGAKDGNQDEHFSGLSRPC